MTFQLTSDEAGDIVALVREELRDMSYEIAATDNSRYRAHLAERRQALLDVVNRLSKPVAPSEGGAPAGEGWTVHISFREDDSHARADAWLSAGGLSLHSWGVSRRNPSDPDVPAVGEQLAVARALSDLSHQLLHAAAHGVESFEGHPVHVEA